MAEAPVCLVPFFFGDCCCCCFRDCATLVAGNAEAAAAAVIAVVVRSSTSAGLWEVFATSVFFLVATRLTAGKTKGRSYCSTCEDGPDETTPLFCDRSVRLSVFNGSLCGLLARALECALACIGVVVGVIVVAAMVVMGNALLKWTTLEICRCCGVVVVVPVTGTTVVGGVGSLLVDGSSQCVLVDLPQLSFFGFFHMWCCRGFAVASAGLFVN